MNPVIETIEALGLAPDAQVEKVVDKLSDTEILVAAKTIHSSILKAASSLESDSNTLAFNFVASSSARGDEGCTTCSWSKLEHLAKYAALYADKLLVPVPLHVKCPANIPSHIRATIVRQVHRINLLRPVIDAGIVELIPDHICSSHFGEASDSYQQIFQLADEFTERFKNSFNMYLPVNSQSKRIEFTGPSEFIEHGSVNTKYRVWPEWAPKVRGLSKKFKLSARTVQASGRVNNLFRSMASDIIVHKRYGHLYNASYFTNLAGEAIFLNATNNQNSATRLDLAAHTLSHSVPLFNELELATIVRIRREEPDAFTNYRNTLTKAIRSGLLKSGEFSKKEAQQLFKEELQPEIDGLRTLANNKRNSLLKKSVRAVIGATAAVGVGVATGTIVPTLAAMLKLATVSATAQNVTEQLAERTSTSDEVVNNRLYYLFRLEQHAKHI